MAQRAVRNCSAMRVNQRPQRDRQIRRKGKRESGKGNGRGEGWQELARNHHKNIWHHLLGAERIMHKIDCCVDTCRVARGRRGKRQDEVGKRVGEGRAQSNGWHTKRTCHVPITTTKPTQCVREGRRSPHPAKANCQNQNHNQPQNNNNNNWKNRHKNCFSLSSSLSYHPSPSLLTSCNWFCNLMRLSSLR